VETPDDLPVYPIRIVAALTGVDARRLRSWDAEYQLVRPARTRGGHRLYAPRDLRLIREIRRLVDDEGLSLQGIKAWFATQRTLADGQADAAGDGKTAGTNESQASTPIPAGGPTRVNG